jgi:undecaprenyl-diphosphatase
VSTVLVASAAVSSIADTLLGLQGWAAVAVVFLLPALESSAFVGFLFPGEIAILIGGVLASQHKVSLPAVIIAAVAGAVIGDTIGYEVGKHWGRRLLHGTVGRFVKHEHLERAERYLASRGGKAVFFGRFTAALRVLIPGLAGMSGMPYRTFLFYNATGGAIWATASALAGYLAGNSWRRVEKVAGRASLLLLVLVVVVGGVVLLGRWASRHQDDLRAVVDRQLDRRGVARRRERYRRQLDFLARRLSPGEARGLSLTVSLVILALGGWLFGVVLEDVSGHNGSVGLDQPVLDWFARHREPWLTDVMRVVTALGSSAVLVPLGLVAGLWWWRRRRDLSALVFLATTYVGAGVLFQVIKRLTGRARPPSAEALGHFSGLAFPSGHATLATAMWGAFALLVSSATPSWRRKVVAWTAAVLVALLVGVTRLYLGAHWLTDVLGGWTLGAIWLTIASIVVRPGRRARAPAQASGRD